MVAVLRHRDHGRIDTLDWVCGAGGTTAGFKGTGRFKVITAANHSPRSVATYGLNNPEVDVRQADLQEVDPIDMPAARVLISTPECTNHSGSNAQRLYDQGPSIFRQDGPDPELEEYLRQERSRATMACSLRYSARHLPEFAIHENVVEVGWWGVEIPGKKRGDGTTYQWWKREWQTLGYEVHELFLNAATFGAPQSRDRFIMVCRRKDVPVPDFSFTPDCWCSTCERVVAGRQTWRKRTKAWPLIEWGRMGRQWDYTCPTCKNQAQLCAAGAYTVVDWSDLGETIGSRVERGKGLADSTIERVRRGFAKWGDEAWIMPCRTASYGTMGPVTQPIHTLTARQDKALCMSPALIVELRNGGSVKSGQKPVRFPLGAITAGGNQHYLAVPPAMFAKNNGPAGATAYHPITDPFGTVTGVDSTSLVSMPGGAFISPYYRTGAPSHVTDPMPTVVGTDRFGLATVPGDVDINDVHFRMLKPALHTNRVLHKNSDACTETAQELSGLMVLDPTERFHGPASRPHRPSEPDQAVVRVVDPCAHAKIGAVDEVKKRSL
jgi:DNA (cytosine-5)-methyltransferase 1